ncbi:CHASE domain-containing protein [Variovorax sp. YR752]|uniref:CHASE domain-containing protein n=1 Tax=Variovorax sp. YR752 TaxID=1884383 RepID=UPI0031377461
MPADAPAADPQPPPGRWLAAAVLLAGLLLTACFAAWSWQREAAEQQGRFERRTDRFAQLLAGRVQSYTDTLPGLRVFDGSDVVLNDAEFAQYVEAISLQRRFPGLALTFVAELVRPEHRANFITSVREDRSRWIGGHPGFDIRPGGERPEHMVIRHVHPPEAQTFGYDLYDPGQAYRPEVEAALRSGGYVATGPILLARDRGGTLVPALTSVVIRAGTYETVLPPATVDERLRLAKGVVGIAFRTAELVRSSIPAELHDFLHVRITDAQAARHGQAATVFDSAWLDPGRSREANGPVRKLMLDVADRRWDIEVGVQQGASPDGLDNATMLALLLGVLLSGSLAAMTHTLVRAHAGKEREVREATAQLQAEKRSLEQSERRYRMLFENSMDAVLRTRPDGGVLAANPAACALFRASEAQLRALGRGGMVDESDPRLAALLEQRARSGSASGQLRMRRADGSLFEAELSSTTYVDDDGAISSSLIVRDVTDRERAAAQQAELTSILDATPDYVASATPEGELTFLNRAGRRMLGLAVDAELTGLRFEHCHPPWAVRAILEVGVPAARRSGVWAGQLAIACADGHELPVSQVIICLRDAQGKVTRMSTVARDLSDLHAAQAQQRELETRLREAQKMESIGTLAGGVAHDFNNVLAAILGNLSIAREDLAPDHPAQRPLVLVNQAAVRARSLVQQILAFSRRLPQERVVQPLAPLVEESIALLHATLPASVQLEARIAAEPLLVEVDAAQIQQVLLNLCTNAWQALPEQNGRIGVELAASTEGTAAAAPTHARLRVSDDGCGMDEATRSRIFEPFFTTKPVGQGTGLGLAVVHGIVTASGGRIVVDSAPGRGTRIDVFLPLRDAPAGLPASPATAQREAHRGHGERVLLVDDDDVVGMTIEALLLRAGYQVTRVDSGLAAIETVRGAPQAHELVVTDYNMPGLSGLAVAEQLASIAPQLPVVITSGYVTEELLARAHALGVRGVLLKEHSLERLAGVVSDALAGGPAIGPG